MTRGKRRVPRHASRYAAASPDGRPGTSAEVADAVVFLASDEAAHIHGVILPVDGGYLAARIEPSLSETKYRGFTLALWGLSVRGTGKMNTHSAGSMERRRNWLRAGVLASGQQIKGSVYRSALRPYSESRSH